MNILNIQCKANRYQLSSKFLLEFKKLMSNRNTMLMRVESFN